MESAVAATATARGGGDSLQELSEATRVRSEDLSQEAHGLKRNAEDMGHQLDMLRQKWKEHTVMVRQVGNAIM